MKKLLKIILPFLKNKYIITITIFFFWLLFFDNNNLVDRIGMIRQIKQLGTDKEYYLKKIEEDSRKLKELKTNKNTLEKFAREQYLMKKDDEDIFIVNED